VSNVARPWVVVAGVDVSVEDVVERVDEFIDCDAATTANVERFASHVALRSQNIRLDGVVDEREVAGLLAITIDDGAFPVEHQRDEFGDDGGVVAVWVLAWLTDVEVSECGGVDVVELARLEREFLRVVLQGAKDEIQQVNAPGIALDRSRERNCHALSRIRP